MPPTPESLVTDVATLERLYGAPAEASVLKEVPRLTPGYRALIEASPFAVLATSGPEGLDCSPRGDAPGFVHIEDDATLWIPDRRGNHRIDSLRNIVRDPRVALLFFVPGRNETLRVIGRAAITTDPPTCERFAVDGRVPRTVLVVTIETVYFQCARALLRSRLWHPVAPSDGAALPSAGALLHEASAGRLDGAAYDRGLPDRLRTTLY
jgi:uncharacterized protein